MTTYKGVIRNNVLERTWKEQTFMWKVCKKSRENLAWINDLKAKTWKQNFLDRPIISCPPCEHNNKQQAISWSTEELPESQGRTYPCSYPNLHVKAPNLTTYGTVTIGSELHSTNNGSEFSTIHVKNKNGRTDGRKDMTKLIDSFWWLYDGANEVNKSEKKNRTSHTKGRLCLFIHHVTVSRSGRFGRSLVLAWPSRKPITQGFRNGCGLVYYPAAEHYPIAIWS